MKIKKAEANQVETLVANGFECWQYHDCVMLEIMGQSIKLSRPEARRLIKFIEKGDRNIKRLKRSS